VADVDEKDVAQALKSEHHELHEFIATRVSYRQFMWTVGVLSTIGAATFVYHSSLSAHQGSYDALNAFATRFSALEVTSLRNREDLKEVNRETHEITGKLDRVIGSLEAERRKRANE